LNIFLRVIAIVVNYSRLKEARLLLNLSQAEIADKSGVSQRDISQLESGKKIFIPTSYIQFLNHSGIDLNSLFSEGQTITMQAINANSDKKRRMKLETIICPQCELRERLLAAKDETISALRALLKECEHE